MKKKAGAGALFFALCISTIFFNLAGAGFYVEGGLGAHGLKQDYWIGRDDIGGHYGFGWIKRDIYIWPGVQVENLDLDIGYDHASQLLLGWPVNNKTETRNDSILMILRYEWR